ncbi:hypothetical protein B296_00019937 [Ensete ventricosum]|uniref:Pectate lyase superfamily protein domain-containing protein n=1 Tax=Ensete ventricosum TaxID=4639 RepID=A0A427AM99_ENSVE|nr:hypothetical protein B296_00019937 [Ensete ventricosum]
MLTYVFSTQLLEILMILAIIGQSSWAALPGSYCKEMGSSTYRPHSVSVTEFGAVGDGITLNTKAFQNAIFYLHSFADKGGAQLFVPAGKWLTGSFSLISHLTLSLDKDAVIIGSMVSECFKFAVLDSSDNVCIEDCYISTGDDLIVIKSGWDEYGISFARPSSNISIRHIVGEASSGAGIALGSEMSGGISNVRADDICLFNSLYGIRIKTSPGRGGYVRNIHISNVIMTNVKTAIGITGRYGEHPDENYDPNALPVVDMITIEDVSGTVIKHAGTLEGIEGDNFSSICLSNVHLNVTSKHPWKCSYIEGFSNLVTPELCESLRNPYQSSVCYTANHFDCCNLVQAA